MSVSPNCAAPWNELRRNPVCMLRWLGRWPPRDWPPKAIRKRAAPRAGPPHSVSARAPTGVRGLLARRSCPTNEAVLTHHQERVLRYPQRCCEIRPLGRGSLEREVSSYIGQVPFLCAWFVVLSCGPLAPAESRANGTRRARVPAPVSLHCSNGSTRM